MFDGASSEGSPAKCIAARRIPATGRQIYPGMVPGSELGWDPVNGLQPLGIAENHFRYVVFNDPTWDYRKLNFDADIALTDKIDNGLINATDPDLRPFFARGGKLLQYHGWNDQQISPLNSINYYKSVLGRLGGATKVAGSYRLFMEPGMMHCTGGQGSQSIQSHGRIGALAGAPDPAPDRFAGDPT